MKTTFRYTKYLQGVMLLWLLLIPAQMMTGQDNRTVSFRVYVWPDLVKSREPVRERHTPLPKNTDLEGSQMGAYMERFIQYAPSEGDEPVRIVARDRRLSPEYTYEGAGPIQFFREVEVADGQKIRAALASAPISENISKALILLLPTGVKDKPYISQVVDISNENHAPGKITIYNMTKRPVACVFDDQRLVIAPQNNRSVNYSPAEDNTILVRLASESEGVWAERYAKRAVVKDDAALVAFVYTLPQNEKSYRVQFLEL